MIETIKVCPVCDGNLTGYEFQIGIRRIERCHECNTLFDRSFLAQDEARQFYEIPSKLTTVMHVNELEANVNGCIEKLKDRGFQQG